MPSLYLNASIPLHPIRRYIRCPCSYQYFSLSIPSLDHERQWKSSVSWIFAQALWFCASSGPAQKDVGCVWLVVILPCWLYLNRTSSNPLVLHGRHFGRTVFALCNYPALLTAGILRLEELQDSSIEDYPAEWVQLWRLNVSAPYKAFNF
jgi:hypothetical protein